MNKIFKIDNINGESDGNYEAEHAKNSPDFWQILFSWLDDLALFFVMFILLLSFVVRPVIVDGSSMYPTLKNADVVLLYNTFYTPNRGDIVVATAPTKPNDPIVKRVIAVGGDVINIDYDTNTVTVNGESLTEDYINSEDADVMEFHGLENYSYPYTVPEGTVFCMGDNRNDSRDSRDMVRYGAIDEGNILGRVFFRVYGEVSNGEKVFGWVD